MHSPSLGPSALPAAAPAPAWIQLVQYLPCSGRARAIGAVWRDERQLHWASPLARRFEGIFNPLPFMLTFPEAQPECAFFEAALEWFDATCFAAADPQQVRAACERAPDWRLGCQSYPGTDHGADLAARLGMAPDWKTLSVEQWRNAVFESVEHLATHHAALRDAPLEPVHDDSMEIGRLHLAEGRRIRILAHPHGGRADAGMLALLADERLRARGEPGDRTLLVLPQLGSPRPLPLTRRVSAVGPEFSAIARALIDFAASA